MDSTNLLCKSPVQVFSFFGVCLHRHTHRMAVLSSFVRFIAMAGRQYEKKKAFYLHLCGNATAPKKNQKNNKMADLQWNVPSKPTYAVQCLLMSLAVLCTQKMHPKFRCCTSCFNGDCLHLQFAGNFFVPTLQLMFVFNTEYRFCEYKFNIVVLLQSKCSENKRDFAVNSFLFRTYHLSSSCFNFIIFDPLPMLSSNVVILARKYWITKQKQLFLFVIIRFTSVLLH